MSGGSRRLGIVIAVPLLLTMLPVVGPAPSALGQGPYVPHDPIQIVFNSGFTSDNGVTRGNGTADDPYVIEGWEISGSTAFGIEITSTSAHFVVRNVLIHGPSTGVHFLNLQNGRIEGSVIHSVSNVGIHIEGVTDAHVVSNNISSIPGLGIRVESSSGITVGGNDVSSSTGIAAYGSSESSIDGNNVTDGGLIYVVGSDRIELRWNRLVNSTFGIDLERSTNVNATGNILDRHGLLLAGDARSHFASHTIGTGNLVGARPIRYYRDCSGLQVTGLPTASLIIANCTASRFANFSIGDIDLAIHVAFSNGIALEDNRVWGTVTGIGLYAANETTLRNNTIAWSSATGIVVTASAEVTIEGNDITHVRGYGFSIYFSSGLYVHHNNVVDVWAQASDSPGGNAWDAGYPAGGNYWSVWMGWNDECSGPGQDVCSGPDGIYDIPFAIATEATDRYPLTGPVGARGGGAVNATLYGSSADGWGHDSLALSNPGPRLLAWQGSPFHLTLVSSDGGTHSWFVDLDGDSVPDASEPSSPDFSGNAGFEFTPDLSGNFTYRCRFHATTMTGILEIRPFEPAPGPNTRPLASFVVTPTHGNQMTLFRVDASASSDAEDAAPFPEIRWDWEGDGIFDTDWTTTKTAEHMYDSGGEYAITLEVSDTDRLTARAVQAVTVEMVLPAPLVLRPYSHASGFALPIPQGWTVLENQTFEGGTLELTLLGPLSGGVQTNLIVDTGEDSAVQETDAYVQDLVNATVAAAQALTPNRIEITEGPLLRRIADHVAVSFKLEYENTSLNQRGVIVVSEPHRRYWVLVLTTDAFSFPVMDEGFGRMLEAFEITLAPAEGSFGTLPSWILFGSAMGAAAAVAAAIAVLLLRQRKARAVGPAAPPGPAVAYRFCSGCGSPANDSQAFCMNCGAPLQPP